MSAIYAAAYGALSTWPASGGGSFSAAGPHSLNGARDPVCLYIDACDTASETEDREGLSV